MVAASGHPQLSETSFLRSKGPLRELSFYRSKTGNCLKRRRESRIGRVDLKFSPGVSYLAVLPGHSRAVSIRASTRSTSAMAASNAANVAPELVSTDLLSSSAVSVARCARGRARMIV